MATLINDCACKEKGKKSKNPNQREIQKKSSLLLNYLDGIIQFDLDGWQSSSRTIQNRRFPDDCQIISHKTRKIVSRQFSQGTLIDDCDGFPLLLLPRATRTNPAIATLMSVWSVRLKKSVWSVRLTVDGGGPIHSPTFRFYWNAQCGYKPNILDHIQFYSQLRHILTKPATMKRMLNAAMLLNYINSRP